MTDKRRLAAFVDSIRRYLHPRAYHSVADLLYYGEPKVAAEILCELMVEDEVSLPREAHTELIDVLSPFALREEYTSMLLAPQQDGYLLVCNDDRETPRFGRREHGGSLDDWEIDALEKLISGSGLAESKKRALGEQAATARATERVWLEFGVFVALKVDCETRPTKTIRVVRSAKFEGASNDGGVMLLLDSQGLCELSGYTCDDPWPASPRVLTWGDDGFVRRAR